MLDAQGTKCHRYLYLLEDTDFTVKLNLPIETDVYANRGKASIIPSGLAHLYSREQLNVPANLAMWYCSTIGQTRIKRNPAISRAQLAVHLVNDSTWTELEMPRCSFTQHVPCINNWIDRLFWTQRFTFDA